MLMNSRGMNQELMYRAIEVSMHAVIFCDFDLIIEWVNSEFLRKFDLEDVETAKGMSIRSLLEYPESIDDPMQELKETGRWQGELRFRRSDGSIIDTLVTATILPDTDGTPLKIIASGMDITEEKQAEDILRESEERFRTVFETARDYIFIKDRSLRYTQVNPAMEQLFELPASELIGKTDEDLFEPESAMHIKETDIRVLSGETSDEEHTKPVKGIERIFHVIKVPMYDSSGGVSGICGISRDITERKRADAALQESEERFRLLLDQVPGVAVQGYGPDGTIHYWNHANVAVYGYTQDEAIGKNLLDLIIPPEIREPVRQIIAHGAKTGEMPPAAEHVLLRKDGSRVSVFSSHAVLQFPDREPELFCLDVDITERKRLEDQLRQAQKMEAVGQLAGGVAHDFNNLLQVINGFSKIALEDLDSSHPAYDSIEEVARAGYRAGTLVSQLLSFSRRQIINPVDLDLNKVIGKLMKMIRRVIGEHIKLDFVPGHKLRTIQADRGQIEQVLTNLCVNARDAMPDGGTITIETVNVLLNNEYPNTHPWAKPGCYVLLDITDTGCGMDEETLSSVFDPFFTTKEVGKGTGLGLSIVYGIVKQHDGQIQSFSEVSKGTTFRIYLPAVERYPVEVSSSVDGPIPGGTETILLAEDDDMVRNLSIMMLERAGYTVIDARDGKEAVRLFEAHADEISLVILDVVMPGLSGRKVYDKIRKIRPDIRVLFNSGYSHGDIHTSFVLDEGLHLIQKPYSPDDLIRRVRELLDT